MSSFWLKDVGFQEHLIVHVIGYIIAFGISYLVANRMMRSIDNKKSIIKFLLLQSWLFIISFLMPYIFGLFKGEASYLSSLWTEITNLLILVIVHSIGNYYSINKEIKEINDER